MKANSDAHPVKIESVECLHLVDKDCGPVDKYSQKNGVVHLTNIYSLFSVCFQLCECPKSPEVCKLHKMGDRYREGGNNVSALRFKSDTESESSDNESSVRKSATSTRKKLPISLLQKLRALCSYLMTRDLSPVIASPA